ncbi:MAG: hypothetical protein IPM39_27685 [Chloroflexi bacterium]|nr:hypothetical protein [Chloroflexota bacterium]
MADERERAELQRHIQEAEERAAAGGHRLALAARQPTRSFCPRNDLHPLRRESSGRLHNAAGGFCPRLSGGWVKGEVVNGRLPLSIG